MVFDQGRLITIQVGHIGIIKSSATMIGKHPNVPRKG
jgi:hypothetical protein